MQTQAKVRKVVGSVASLAVALTFGFSANAAPNRGERAIHYPNVVLGSASYLAARSTRSSVPTTASRSRGPLTDSALLLGDESGALIGTRDRGVGRNDLFAADTDTSGVAGPGFGAGVAGSVVSPGVAGPGAGSGVAGSGGGSGVAGGGGQ